MAVRRISPSRTDATDPAALLVSCGDERKLSPRKGHRYPETAQDFRLTDKNIISRRGGSTWLTSAYQHVRTSHRLNNAATVETDSSEQNAFAPILYRHLLVPPSRDISGIFLRHQIVLSGHCRPGTAPPATAASLCCGNNMSAPFVDRGAIPCLYENDVSGPI